MDLQADPNEPAMSPSSRQGRSENLTHHYSGKCRKQGDAERGEGVLTLGHGEGGHHTGT